MSAALVPSPTLAQSALVFGGANGLGLGISLATGWHYHLDLIGTGVFAVAAWAVGRASDPRQWLSAAGVSLWSVKLASFLFYRALQTKHDGRLTETLSTTSGAVGFWTISFAWGWLVSLPHTIAAGMPVSVRPPLGGWTTWAGAGLYAVGLLTETAADWTKWQFKSDPENKGKFCDAGVWQVSQHPNWFGNLMLWSGILLFNTPTLLATIPGTPAWKPLARFCGAAFSPLFLAALFYGQATDTIAKTAELAQKRYGDDPRFQAYVRDTPLVLPTFKSLRRLFGKGGDML